MHNLRCVKRDYLPNSYYSGRLTRDSVVHFHKVGGAIVRDRFKKEWLK